ncbi:MAG: branched-chain amino acid ABC transporter permease [Anaerolineae bacterium]|nr:branched-chain amino acid ABC transporter permease [Anaerolineae bacterium]
MSGYYQGLLILVGINIIAVLGVSILTGFTRLFSFGNAGFMSIGAYTAAILSTKFGLPFPLTILAGAVMAGIIAFILGKLTLSLKGDYFLIATLGFGESVRVLFNYMVPVTGGARGISGIPGIPGERLLVVIIIVILCVWIARNIIYSKYGRNLMAIREEEMAADAVGIDTARFKNFSFVTSAVFAGVAGSLWAHYFTFISPLMFNLDKSAELTITVVIGGLGSLSGSILATIIITVLPEILRSAAEYRMLAYGIAVVLIITLRPAGIMGYKEFSIAGMRNLWVSFKNLFRKREAQ